MRFSDILVVLPSVNNAWTFAAFVVFLGVWGAVEYLRAKSRRSEK
ncbi:MAG TPA: hypothetical protein VK446_06470 [Methylocystis sp.]|nr:hypothetical protein [Methylocystis sp.]